MTHYEERLVFSRRLHRPRKIIRSYKRLAVFVDPQKGSVEAIARVFIVINISAVVCERALRSKDEANVSVFLISVQLVLASFI